MRHPTFQDSYLTSNLTITTAQFVVYLWSISSSLQLLVLIILSSAVLLFLRGGGVGVLQKGTACLFMLP